MPRVIITQYLYAHTNEDALAIARQARMEGRRSEIITNDEYMTKYHNNQMQNLIEWAEKNGVEFKPSI